MKYNLSKKDWIRIGQKAGWIKCAQEYDSYEDYRDSGAEEEDAYRENEYEELKEKLYEDYSFRQLVEYFKTNPYNADASEEEHKERENKIRETAIDFLSSWSYKNIKNDDPRLGPVMDAINDNLSNEGL